MKARYEALSYQKSKSANIGWNHRFFQGDPYSYQPNVKPGLLDDKNRSYITISCQEKNTDKKCYFFMEKCDFQNLKFTGVLIIKPPLKDFWDSDFFRAFIILKKSQTFFQSFYYLKKFSACGGLLLFSIFLSSHFDLWKVDF